MSIQFERGEALDNITQDMKKELEEDGDEEGLKFLSKTVDTVRKKVLVASCDIWLSWGSSTVEASDHVSLSWSKKGLVWPCLIGILSGLGGDFLNF